MVLNASACADAVTRAIRPANAALSRAQCAERRSPRHDSLPCLTGTTSAAADANETFQTALPR